MTDEQIIKALECCGKGYGNCEGCPYDDENNDCVTMDGRTLIFQDAIDLINRQKAEIERLQQNLEEAHIDIREHMAEIERLEKARQRQAQFLGEERGQKYELINKLDKAKTEAIHEFAERLKGKSHVSLNQCGEMKPLIYFDDIDNLVKEMAGDK